MGGCVFDSLDVYAKELRQFAKYIVFDMVKRFNVTYSDPYSRKVSSSIPSAHYSLWSSMFSPVYFEFFPRSIAFTIDVFKSTKRKYHLHSL